MRGRGSTWNRPIILIHQLNRLLNSLDRLSRWNCNTTFSIQTHHCKLDKEIQQTEKKPQKLNTIINIRVNGTNVAMRSKLVLRSIPSSEVGNAARRDSLISSRAKAFHISVQQPITLQMIIYSVDSKFNSDWPSASRGGGRLKLSGCTTTLFPTRKPIPFGMNDQLRSFH